MLARFARVEPAIHVRVSTMAERDVESTLLNDPEVSFGLAAPYEPCPDLDYTDLFAMTWSLVTPPDHPLASRRSVRLTEVAKTPLILYERGSSGRQHVLDAFHEHALTPRIALEPPAPKPSSAWSRPDWARRSCHCCRVARSREAAPSLW